MNTLWFRGFVVILSLISVLGAPAVALGYSFGDTVAPLGSEEVVFNHSDDTNPAVLKDACAANHIPDVPVRAFKDAANRVQLIISHAGQPGAESHTRRMIGASLNNVTVEDLDPGSGKNCPVIHNTSNNRGGVDSPTFVSGLEELSPGSFDNWEWLASPYTEDGQKVDGLVVNEYHGSEFRGGPGFPSGWPDQCPSGIFTDCWFTSITHTWSINRGDTYPFQGAGKTHLVASYPYKYNTNPNDPNEPTAVPPAGQSVAQGYFAPSNIVKKGDYYYAMFRAFSDYGAQKGGGKFGATCVMRSANYTIPSSWRGYDGNPADDQQQGFTRTFVDPYSGPTAPQQDHVCEPVSPNPSSAGPNASSIADFRLGGMSANLTYNTYFDSWMMVDVGSKPSVGPGGTPVGPVRWGVYYSLSQDLINWSERQLLFEAEVQRNCTGPGTPGPHCQAACEVGTPAVLDPQSTDRNFTTVGRTAYVYFTRFRPNCPTADLNRDLVRIPIRFHQPPRTATGMYWNCPGGTDGGLMGGFAGGTAYAPPNSTFVPSADRSYDSTGNSYQARTKPGGSTAIGVFNKLGEPPHCDSNPNARLPFSLGQGSELLYGGAFFFPRVGFWDKMSSGAKVTLLRLGTTEHASKWAASLSIDYEGRLSLTANEGSGERLMMGGLQHPNANLRIRRPGANEPDTCWHRFDIYQQLGSGGYTMVYIDGVLAGYTTTGAIPQSSNILGAGIISKSPGNLDLTLYFDQLWTHAMSRPAYLAKCE